MSDLRTAAEHEAGHVVMCWILFKKVGYAVAFADGTGLAVDAIELAGIPSPEEDVLITLAGYAVEANYRLGFDCNLESKCADFDIARKTIASHASLRLRDCEISKISETETSTIQEVLTTEEALDMWFDKACNVLFPYFELVDAVADILESKPDEAVMEKDLLPIFQDFIPFE